MDWMIREAQAHGRRIYEPHRVTLEPDPDGTMQNSRGDGLGQLYRQEVRGWDYEARGKPTVHDSVTKRTKNEHNEAAPPYNPWILQEEYEVERSRALPVAPTASHG